MRISNQMFVSGEMPKLTKKLLATNSAISQKQTDTVITKMPIYVDHALFEQFINGDFGEVHTDGTKYWVIKDGKRMEFLPLPPKEENKEIKDTHDVLIETVDVCLDRAQQILDEKFKDWVLKKDMIEKNIGKNSAISLDDILKAAKEKKLLTL